jgi:hypothetical protein
MRRLVLSLMCIAPMVVAGCGGPSEKQPVNEDFSDLAGLDDKSDAFSYRMKLIGSLDYGQTSSVVSYTSSPRFRAFKFAGQKGDKVDIKVHSTNSGDAVTWLVDNGYNVLASNDDADGSLDSHITATLPGNTNPDIVTYMIIFRDYDLAKKKFTVTLAGTPANDFFSCSKDADCVAVPAHVCCPNCRREAVNVDQTDAYANQPLECSTPTICPKIACFLDTRVAECNAGKCELVAIEDVACGGHTINPHACPEGYECTGDGLAYDAPGQCTEAPKPIFCGGIAGIACPDGYECADNPDDSCDPAMGGADCGGICLAKDCRATGCGAGSNCQICWASWACVPDGAVC